MLIGEYEIEVPAVAQSPIGDQAVDGLQIVGLDIEAAVVPVFDRHIFHRDCAERARSARRLHARGNVFEPCLVGGDLDGLAGLRRLSAACWMLWRPCRRVVIVPDADEWPARSRILEIGMAR